MPRRYGKYLRQERNIGIVTRVTECVSSVNCSSTTYLPVPLLTKSTVSSELPTNDSERFKSESRSVEVWYYYKRTLKALIIE